jgi:acetyl esterase/lipase
MIRLLTLLTLTFTAAAGIPPVKRILPPPGVKIPEGERAALEAELTRVTQAFTGLPKRKENANAEVFIKAVRYALELDEFYKPPADIAKARELLAEAQRRIESLRRGEFPWLKAKGLVVRGYYSPIDGSPQPFGLEIPEDAPQTKAPAWIWLRGRADTVTDLHFIAERMKRKGQFQPPGCVVVHPFGRHCTGYKNAGEQDVLDVAGLLGREALIDPRRLALAGFSMGGAGAWLLGAHYTDRWAVVHTGAGFVDVRRYQKLTPEAIAGTPVWEKTLWGQNDVPDYVRNLLNVPLVSYSGEKDKQRASAEIMAEELKAQGLTLTHLIGPGMQHKYHPEVQKDVQQRVMVELLKERPRSPQELHWQSRTLDYARMHWLTVTGLGEHWKEARADAVLDAPLPSAKAVTLTTGNVTSLRLDYPDKESWPGALTITIDGQTLNGGGAGKGILLTRDSGTAAWRLGPAAEPAGLRKSPGLQGPIDDAFTAPFLYVLPDKPCASADVEAWIQWELAHQRDRWRWLMRGEVRAKKASEVTDDDISRYNLILWGDAAANVLTAKSLPSLPIKWTASGVTMGGRKYEGGALVPVAVYPNPLNPQRYAVLNSGLTFREAHSKTNSLQNPHLPDWAVVDTSIPPNDKTPGKVLDAGFFGERWEVK